MLIFLTFVVFYPPGQHYFTIEIDYYENHLYEYNKMDRTYLKSNIKLKEQLSRVGSKKYFY